MEKQHLLLSEFLLNVHFLRNQFELTNNKNLPLHEKISKEEGFIFLAPGVSMFSF